MDMNPSPIDFSPEAIVRRWPALNRQLTAEPPKRTPEQIAERNRRREQWLAERRRDDAIAFARSRGERYAGCRLDSYVCETDAQRVALAKLRSYLGNIERQITTGNGVVLFGTPGTGKDHLLVSLAVGLIEAHGTRPAGGMTYRDERPSGQFSIEWRSGAELFAELRAGIDGDQPEGRILGPVIQCDVLILSDPVPPAGELTRYQSEILYRVVDTRYTARRPTWVSLNVATAAEAAAKLGAPIHDRLRDGALAIYCDWPSYRRPQT